MKMPTKKEEEWVSLSDAARELKTTVQKLSRMAMAGEIKSKRPARDKRLVLVDMVELRRLFEM